MTWNGKSLNLGQLPHKLLSLLLACCVALGNTFNLFSWEGGVGFFFLIIEKHRKAHKNDSQFYCLPIKKEHAARMFLNDTKEKKSHPVPFLKGILCFVDMFTKNVLHISQFSHKISM